MRYWTATVTVKLDLPSGDYRSLGGFYDEPSGRSESFSFEFVAEHREDALREAARLVAALQPKADK